MSLIDSESLEPSGLDVLGSVAEDILNERESQAPSSCMSQSIITESVQSMIEQKEQNEEEFDDEELRGSIP